MLIIFSSLCGAEANFGLFSFHLFYSFAMSLLFCYNGADLWITFFGESLMFVKKNVKKDGEKKWTYYHIVESYKDSEGVTRHNYLANISALPEKDVQAIKKYLRGELAPKDQAGKVEQGDCLRGAGQVAIWRAWKKSGLLEVLREYLTEAQCLSVFAMTASRICDPCSKLALKDGCADTLWARRMRDNRVDEDTLYEVMDGLESSFEDIQRTLAHSQSDGPMLMLYDTTSTYFEGTDADNAEYGFSKDKRFDRYQIIVAMVCGRDGRPLAVELWPGSTTDVETVQTQIDLLRKRFGIEKGVFVGDNGMYSEVNLDYIAEKGFSYIIGGEYHKKKELLCSMSEGQRELFIEEGIYEWVEGDVRYIGCYSECRRHRDSERRKKAMEQVEEELSRLKKTASSGRYYSKERLWAKVDGILKDKKVKSLWNIKLEPLQEAEDDQQKILIELTFSKNEVELKKREAMDGCYVLQTTADPEDMEPEEVVKSYKSLQKVERSFRTIKSFIKIRPIYHRLWGRIRAHVLICFLAYYLSWWMRRELKAQGITTELPTVLNRWDQLYLSEMKVQTDGDNITQWNWSLGEEGIKIKEEIEQAGLWKSINCYKSQCGASRSNI